MDFRYWLEATLAVRQQFGSDRRKSGPSQRTFEAMLMTHSDTSPASIAALRKVYSITSSAAGRGITGTIKLSSFKPASCTAYGASAIFEDDLGAPLSIPKGDEAKFGLFCGREGPRWFSSYGPRERKEGP
jgi:hypothetical protein